MTHVDSPVPGEHLSLWMRDPSAPHAWMRIRKGGDPSMLSDRRVFVEKTPRVYDPSSGVAPDENYCLGLAGPGGEDRWENREGKAIRGPGWIEGSKGHADEGDGPDLASRRWADAKAAQLGYALPDMQAEIDQLKANWRSDPCWDIEDTEGFEEHREELKVWRLQHLAQREAEAKRAHETAVEKLMAPAVKYLQALDDDILAGKRGALTTAEVIRALGDVLLPIVERMEYLDNRQDEERRKLEDHIDRQVRRLDGRS